MSFDAGPDGEDPALLTGQEEAMIDYSTDNARCIAPIVTILETQMTQLDNMGAHIPAAYIDAAIQHLKISSGEMAGRRAP